MSITFTDDRSRIFFEGKPIAACPSWLSGRITDASLTYVEDTAYYYLFITWGDEGVDSHVRVGRSRSKTGPYLDPLGRNLNDWDDAEHPTGFLFLSSFSFDDEDAIRGPFGGHLEGRKPSGPDSTGAADKTTSAKSTKACSNAATGFSAEKSDSRGSERSSDDSDKAASEFSVENSDEKVSEMPADSSSKTGSEFSTEQHGEKFSEMPAENSDKTDSEFSTEQHGERIPEKLAKSSGETSSENSTEQPDETDTDPADSSSNSDQISYNEPKEDGFLTVTAGLDCVFTFHKSGNAEVSFPVIFSDDGWPLICPGEAPEGERVTRAAYSLKELQGFYECVTFIPSVPQVPYSSNFAALLPKDVKGIMSMQSDEWTCPISEDADGRVELGGSIRGSYRLNGSTLRLSFAHDSVSLCMCTATDASNGFPTIFLTGKSDAGIAYMLKKITLPQPNHYNRK